MLEWLVVIVGIIWLISLGRRHEALRIKFEALSAEVARLSAALAQQGTAQPNTATQTNRAGASPPALPDAAATTETSHDGVAADGAQTEGRPQWTVPEVVIEPEVVVARRTSSEPEVGSTADVPATVPPPLNTQPVSETADQERQPAARHQPPAEPQESWGDWITRKAPVIVSRLGIGLLVIGLALAVGYSWEYFGPLFKVAAGFAGAAALIAGGEWISRRKEDWGWYGQAITGGGYALASFVMYAAGNIASVQVIDSPIAGATGLLAIAGASMLHAVYRRSEPLALLSTLLAIITISLSPATGFTVVATAVLLGGLAATIVTQRWFALQYAGMAGSYITFYLFTWNQLIASGFGFEMTLVHLGLFWVVWTAVGLLLYATLDRGSEDNNNILGRFVAVQDRPRLLLGNAVINSAIALALATFTMSAHTEWLYLVLAAAGAMHAVSAYLSHRLRWTENFNVQSILALGMVAAACALKLSPAATSVVWLLEVPVLAYVGLRARFGSFRLSAALLATVSVGWFLLTGLQDHSLVFSSPLPLPYNVFVGGFAIFAMAATAYVYKRFGDNQANDNPLNESAAAQFIYNGIALGLIWLLTVVQAPAEYVPVLLAAEGAILALVAKRHLQFASGALFIGSALLYLLGGYQIATPVTIAIVLGLAIAPKVLHKLDLLNFKRANAENLRLSYVPVELLTLATIAAGLILTFLKVPGDWLACVVAVEMVALTMAGICARDSVVRATAHVAAALTLLTILVMGPWTWQVVIPIVAMFWLMYGVYHFNFQNAMGEDEEFNTLFANQFGGPLEIPLVKNGYWIAGAVVLAIGFMRLLSAELIPVALAAEGLVLGLWSLQVKERQFFLAGQIAIAGALAALVVLNGAATPVTIAFVLGTGLVGRVLHRFDLVPAAVRLPRPSMHYASVELLALLTLASGLLLTLFKVPADHLPWVAAVEMVAVTVVGIGLRDSILRTAGNIAGIVALWSLFALAGQWSWAIVIPVIAMFGVMDCIYRFGVQNALGEDREFKPLLKALGIDEFDLPVLQDGYWLIATSLLTVSFFFLLNWQLLATALAIEGLALIAIGFQVKERKFLLAGLAVFAMLVAKLVFYDLRSAETIWRIISFVVAGGLMMAGAFILARFNKAMGQSERERNRE